MLSVSCTCHASHSLAAHLKCEASVRKHSLGLCSSRRFIYAEILFNPYQLPGRDQAHPDPLPRAVVCTLSGCNFQVQGRCPSCSWRKSLWSRPSFITVLTPCMGLSNIYPARRARGAGTVPWPRYPRYQTAYCHVSALYKFLTVRLLLWKRRHTVRTYRTHILHVIACRLVSLSRDNAQQFADAFSAL